MGIRRGSISTPIIADGLVFNIDAANRASTIPSTSTDKAFNTLDTTISGSFINDTMYDSSTVSPSYAFDGVGDYITVDGFNDITVNTVSMWLKVSYTGNRIILEKGANTKMIFQPASNNAQIFYANSKSYNGGTGYLNSIMDGTWKNWVQIEDTDFSYFYVNGVLQDSQSNSSNSTNSNPLNIMCRSTLLSHGQTGNVGPVHIYNHALSSTEVLHNYNALKGRFS